MASADTERKLGSDGSGGNGSSGCGSAGLHASLRRSLYVQLAEKDRREAEERLGGFGKEACVGATPTVYVTGRAPTPPPPSSAEEVAASRALQVRDRRERRSKEAQFPSSTLTFEGVSTVESDFPFAERTSRGVEKAHARENDVNPPPLTQQDDSDRQNGLRDNKRHLRSSYASDTESEESSSSETRETEVVIYPAAPQSDFGRKCPLTCPASRSISPLFVFCPSTGASRRSNC